MNKIRKTITILGIGIAAGIVGLFLVYMLPVRPMQDNLKETLAEFMSEGENPFLLTGYKGSSLDNLTDAIMLGNAVYENDMSFWQSAMRNARASDVKDFPMEALEQYLISGESEEKTEYARYWHGYLVILKPLLLLFNYNQIRIINGCTQFGLILWILHELRKRNMKCGMVAYVFSILSMFPMTLPYSLQFSSMFYTGNIALLLILKNHEKWKQEEKHNYFFLIVGMCTSYLDFLTYPLFTFGMPMVMCLVLNKYCSLKDRVCFLLKNGITWGTGYAFMWAGKWVAGSLITGENLLSSALGVASFRMSGQAYDESLNRIMAILRNGYIYFNLAGVILAAAVLIWIFVFVWKKRDTLNAEELLPLGMAACMPFLWYLVIANHSYTHYWYTFRALAVSVFALAMIPECIGSKTMEMERAGKGI